MKPLKDLFGVELADLYDAEQRSVLGLAKMAKAASCPKLGAMLEAHVKGTGSHIARLEEVVRSLDAKIGARKCEAVIGLLKEADDIAAAFQGSSAINVALIAIAQKLEHYKIASYGCLREWAGLLDYADAAVVLDEILAQEKATDEAFTALARSGQNEEACGNELDVETFAGPYALENFQPVGESIQ
jgi:ferritin-like metal-binding protein YciE